MATDQKSGVGVRHSQEVILLVSIHLTGFVWRERSEA